MVKRDNLDIEISERQRQRARAFDLCEERPQYERLLTDTNMSEASLRQCALKLGPAFVYTLYVHSVKLLEALNLSKRLMCQTKANPFAPYINIVETPEFDEGEWCLEANEQRVGSNFPW